MYKTLLAIAAAGNLAAATPLASRQVVPHYPPHESSTGFLLVANVTDPASDLTPSVHGWRFQGIHTGAGLNDASLLPTGGEIFYHNGTAEEIYYGQGSIVTDEGTQPFPVGIYVQAEDEFDYTYPAEHDVAINVGSGTIGVSLGHFPDPYFPLTGPNAAGTYAACPRHVPYYGDEEIFTVVRFVYAVFNEDTALYEYPVPEDCAKINLIPQCATLPTLPASGSLSSHDFAANSSCYADVASINWSEYGP